MESVNVNLDGRDLGPLALRLVELISIGMESVACVIRDMQGLMELVDHAQLEQLPILIKLHAFVEIPTSISFPIDHYAMFVLLTHIQILQVLTVTAEKDTLNKEINVFTTVLLKLFQTQMAFVLV